MRISSSRTPGTRSVLLVEKHAAFRQALAHALEQRAGFGRTYQAESLADTGDRSPEAVDIAIVDLGSSSSGELDTVRALRDAYPSTALLALTLSRDPADHARAVRAGANLVLNKEESIWEILRVAMSFGARASSRYETGLPGPDGT